MDISQPQTPTLARKLIRNIVDGGGDITYAEPHAIYRLRQRKISTQDCENVLRAGIVQEPEWENGAWRYQVTTRTFVVVIELISESELLIVTAWRI